MEFSIALMRLLEKLKQQSPNVMVNAETMLCNQFVEYMNDSTLRQELKQLVRRQPNSTLLEVRSEALLWELEGRLGGAGARSLCPMGFSMVFVGIGWRGSYFISNV